MLVIGLLVLYRLDSEWRRCLVSYAAVCNGLGSRFLVEPVFAARNLGWGLWQLCFHFQVACLCFVRLPEKA